MPAPLFHLERAPGLERARCVPDDLFQRTDAVAGVRPRRGLRKREAAPSRPARRRWTYGGRFSFACLFLS